MEKTLMDQGLNGHNYNYRLAGHLWHLYVSCAYRFMMCINGRIYMPQDKEKGLPQRLTMKRIQGHIAGYYNIGVFASAKSARFICFDVDVEDVDLVRRIIDILVGFGFRRDWIYPSISGGKGYHIEIFVDKPVANATLERLYQAVVAEGELDRRVVEFRPQEGLSIRMPLSPHYKTGRMAWYCNAETLEPIETTDYIFEIEQVPRDVFCGIVDSIKVKNSGSRSVVHHMKAEAAPEDGRPVIREPHTRHNLMVKYATYLRKCGYQSAAIYKRLMEWVHEQDRSLISSTDKEIEEDARLIAVWMDHIEAGDIGRHNSRGAFGSDDLNYILNGNNKTERRILFRSLMAHKIFGGDQTKQRTIGAAFDMTESAVRKRLKSLTERGVMKILPGIHGTNAAHGWFTTPNSYVPGDGVKAVLDPADFAGGWELGEKLTWKNLKWYYATAMGTMLGDKLEKYVGRSEATEIRGWIAAGPKIMD